MASTPTKKDEKTRTSNKTNDDTEKQHVASLSAAVAAPSSLSHSTQSKTQNEQTVGGTTNETRERKVYIGSIREYNKNGWRVEISTKSKVFNWKKFGGKDKAREAAVDWKRRTNDELQLTKIETIPLAQIEQPSDEKQQYISGFFDGDGSVVCTRSKLAVIFGQSRNSGIPPVLTWIQKYYGGSIRQQTKKKSAIGKHRDAYVLQLNKRGQLRFLLPMLTDNCTLKQPQVSAALSLLKKIPDGRVDGSANRSPFLVLDSKLKSQKTEYHSVAIDPKKLTPAYLAGLTDADGSVWMDDTLHLSITKPSCPNLLDAIKITRGNGTVLGNQKYYQCRGDNAKAFIRDILPYSIVKKDQLELALTWRELQVSTHKKGNKKREVDAQVKMDKLAESCKRLKKS
jgi:hypothetical protein